MKSFHTIFIIVLFINSQVAAQDNCLDFDGNDDWVNVPSQDLTGMSQLTLEALVYADDITSSYWSEIYRQNGSGIPAAYLLAFQNNGTILSFGVNTSTGYLELDVNITPSTYVGSWHHIAGVYDGTTMILYVDGNPIGSSNHSGTLSMSSPTTHRIGVNVSAEYIDARIDEVRLWTVARSQGDIINNKDCALYGPINGLVAVYNFNETSGTNAADGSGNGFDGTLMNGPVWVGSTVAVNCNAGLEDLSNNEKVLVKIVDLMGREIEDKANTLLFYVFSDGTAEKVFRVE